MKNKQSAQDKTTIIKWFIYALMRQKDSSVKRHAAEIQTLKHLRKL